MVREGLMTYESLMASINGPAPCSVTCGTGGGGGSGGKAVYGYTGTSPPDGNKQIWNKCFLCIAATFLLGIMLLFVACEDTKIENDRIAELLLKGENVKSSDFKTAEKNLEDGDILHAVSDGKFHSTPKEYSASEIAWLVKRLKELESTGKGVIQGKNYINPRDFTPEDSTYLANLGFQVYRYGDDDPCKDERKAVCIGAQDSCAHAHYTRSLIYPALNEPINCEPGYWRVFNADDIQRETFRDSVYRHIWVVDHLCRSPPVEGPIKPAYNPENMEIFYEACTVYVYQVIPDMEEKRAALKECEDENSGINFPQMKSGTFQMQNREGILDGRRKMLKRVVSG
ncbi:MAG: hypothetical protein FWH18_07485 [Marinilabiliaceae bacterium]|nr:hypothetical protein [Marinilabiliaceae bacterium]